MTRISRSEESRRDDERRIDRRSKALAPRPQAATEFAPFVRRNARTAASMRSVAAPEESPDTPVVDLPYGKKIALGPEPRTSRTDEPQTTATTVDDTSTVENPGAVANESKTLRGVEKPRESDDRDDDEKDSVDERTTDEPSIVAPREAPFVQGPPGRFGDPPPRDGRSVPHFEIEDLEKIVEFAAVSRTPAGVVEFSLGLDPVAFSGVRLRLRSAGKNRIILTTLAGRNGCSWAKNDLDELARLMREHGIDVVSLVRRDE